MILKHPSSRTIDWDIKDSCEQTPLDIAKEKGHDIIVDFIHDNKIIKKKVKFF